MLGGGRVRVNTRSFQNDMCTFHTKDDVLTLLIHLGYLAYDSEKKETFIPNGEIVEEFETAMSASGWPEVMRVLKASEKLLEDTLKGDAMSVTEALDRAHTEVSSILTYNDENSLSCAISLAYYSARKDYRMIREMPAGHGFADIVFLPLPHTDKPALVIEPRVKNEFFTRQVCAASNTNLGTLAARREGSQHEYKYNKSAESAIQQMKDRHYAEALEGYSGTILLVGVNYDKEDKNKPHSCVIERIDK